jgi:hypothetical protein
MLHLLITDIGLGLLQGIAAMHDQSAHNYCTSIDSESNIKDFPSNDTLVQHIQHSLLQTTTAYGHTVNPNQNFMICFSKFSFIHIYFNSFFAAEGLKVPRGNRVLYACCWSELVIKVGMTCFPGKVKI